MYRKCTLLAAMVLTAGLSSSDGENHPGKKAAAVGSARMVKDVDAKRANVDLVIFACTIDRDNAMSIAPKNLYKHNKSAQALVDAVSNYGDTKFLLRSTRSIAFSGEVSSVSHGANMPCVRGVSVSKNGKTIRQIEYEEVGTIVNMSGTWDETRPIPGTLSVDVELSEVISSDIPIGNEVMAPVMAQLQFELDCAFQLGNGQLFIVNGPPTSDPSTVTMIVGRLEVTN